MPYHDHFKHADDLISHLNGVVSSVKDQLIATKYVGFVAVACTTVYELAIKEIFIAFSEKKDKVFGVFAEKYFDRLNGRIKTKHLTGDHIIRFGGDYVKCFKEEINMAEDRHLNIHRISILSSYNNVIEWRHQFAHQGEIPTTATYDEVTKSFEAGKEVIHCLHRTMK
jgi:hypothetical protein